ncbi:MAG: hypothetical protein ACTHK8_10245 [Ginsengibacter sp.]
MSIYLKLMFRTFTIWLLTASINGVLTGTAISIIKQEYDLMTGNFIIVGILSLVFSIPGFFIFWLFLLFSAARHKRDRDLFRSALSSGFILSAITAACGYHLLFAEVKNYAIALVLLITFSCLGSIMLHFKYFKNLK